MTIAAAPTTPVAVFGARGVVGAGARTAAVLGCQALLDGGTAVDAAVTAALAETVLMPPKCGLAGDLVALAWLPGWDRPRALLAIGPAAAGLAGQATTGGPSVGVPGAPAGYAALAGLGRLGLERLTTPAIQLAERGVAWSTLCAALAAEADDLLRAHAPDGCRYRPADGPLAPGTRLRLPGLARLLTEFAERGGALFAGEPGKHLVTRVRRAGGVLTLADLAAARAEWADAVTGTAGERTVWATPAPTYGPALLGALREADRGGDLAAAARSAVRRLRGTATPAAPGGATAQPAAGRAPARATATGSAGSVEGTSVIEGTSVVGATDDEGAIVVIVHSNSFPQFGSGLIVDEYDLVLSNRAGRGFGRPGAPDGPAPGRRPPTTLHAWALGAGGDGDGRPTLFGATPGGEQQVAWNAQVITGLLDRIDADDAHESGAGRGLPTAAVLGHALDRVLTTRRWSTTATGTVWADETATAVRPAHVVVGRAGGDALVGAADPGIGATAVGV